MPDQYRIVEAKMFSSPDGYEQVLRLQCRLVLDGQEVPARIAIRPRLDREIIVHGAMTEQELAKVLAEAADQYRKFRAVAEQLVADGQAKPLPAVTFSPPGNVASGKP